MPKSFKMTLKNIKKHREKINLIVIGIIQIFILITLIPSNSYFIGQSNELIENLIIKERNNKKNFNLINSGINLLIGFLAIKQIGIVSAQDDNAWWCCEILDSNGADCQDISAGEDTLCRDSERTWQTACQLTTECKLGTCIDEEEGFCYAGTPKKDCENWDVRNIYEIPECQLGCCSLDEGTRKEWWANLKCDNEGGSFSSIPQSECKVLTEEMGACVFGDNNCKFTTEEDCVNNLGGNPWPGLLCTNPDLNTICSRPETPGETQTTCYNGKVYFLDTCGEMANIYNSLKWDDDDYWKFTQTTTCDALDNPETCGNCDGSNNICASSSEAEIPLTYGNYACKDIRCDDNGETRSNLESWCVYESYIGDSRDVVGSSHIRKICNEGEIEYDICDVYRGEICAGVEANDGSSVARCRINEGIKCLAANEDIEPYEYDEDNELINEQETHDENNETCLEISPDCRLESIDVDDYFKFDACVPKYPPGFDLIDVSSADQNKFKDRCNIASQTCTTVWRKLIKWRCKENCECLTQEFANKMNDLCISLGDCGGYVNIAGKYTNDGFETFDIDELSDKKYNLKHNIDEDNHADGSISESKKEEYIDYANDINTEEFPSYFSGAEMGYFGGIDALEFDIGDVSDYRLGYGITATLIALGAAWGLASIEALTTIIAGFSTAFPPAFIIFVIITAIFVGLGKLLGIGEVKEVDINFECKLWQPPSGGDDCDICNENPETCTEYKCESLGAGCELIDKYELYDSEVNVCYYAFKNDHTDAKIIPHFTSSGYEFASLSSNTAEGIKIEVEGGGCIQEFSQINFSLKTINPANDEDEYAKCAWNWERVDPDPIDDYQNVPQGEDFKESPYDSIEHTFEGRLPFVSSLDSQDITGNVPGERTGELNMYVRCKDRGDNFNFDSYVVNFCIKEGADNEIATIKEFIPADNSFLTYGKTTKTLTIYLDEPAECNWTLGTDKPIQDMENIFSCAYTKEDHPELGGRCTTTLTGLTQPVNNIYIKCKDQPWISKEGYDGPWTEEDRNVNSEGFLYTLYATESPLSITSISPQGEVAGGGSIFQIDLEVTTSGGMDNGISICRYLFVESPSGITSGDFFSQTGSTIHTQPFSPPGGDYNIAIECKDDAGNNATGNAIFNLIRDEDFPEVVRAYYENGKLNLITNEIAKCYYLDRCGLSITDDTPKFDSIGYSTEHKTNWIAGQTYNVKCEDTWGNVNPRGCDIRIIPTS